MARNWADLPQDLLELCSRRLCSKDLSAFRGVCRSWQSAAVAESSHVPGLMLPDIRERLRRNFFCLSCWRNHKVLLPEAETKRCFSSRGWVLTICKNWEVHMLKNPTSRHNHVIKLPNFNKFPGVEDSHFHWCGDFAKFVLSDNPMTSPDYRVIVMYGRSPWLQLWKSGDGEWTAMNSLSPRHSIFDVIFFKGNFLVLDGQGTILRYDLDGSPPFEAQVVFRMPPRFLPRKQSDLLQPTTECPLFMTETHLVQSTTGCLLYVSQWVDRAEQTFRFLVLEINLDAQTCTEVKSLENSSLFLGCNSSFALEVDEKHHIEPNCIYFSDTYPNLSEVSEEERDPYMGIYHLEDCTVELISMEKPDCECYPPIWVEPSFFNP